MDSQAEQLSHAICVYLGYGRSPSPGCYEGEVIRALGELRGKALIEKIEFVLVELGQIDVDWSKTSLAESESIVRAFMAKRHPEFTEEALRALVWKFTYDWR